MRYKRMVQMSQQKGFTLLELIVAIAIVAILATMAVPAFNSTMARSKVTSNTNLIVGAMNYARAEAIERRLSVIVRSLSSGGWEVIADSGGANEELLQTFDPSNQGLTVSFANITFENDGFRTSGSSKTDILVSDSNTEEKRRICISVSGSVEINKDGGVC